MFELSEEGVFCEPRLERVSKDAEIAGENGSSDTLTDKQYWFYRQLNEAAPMAEDELSCEHHYNMRMTCLVQVRPVNDRTHDRCGR